MEARAARPAGDRRADVAAAARGARGRPDPSCAPASRRAHGLDGFAITTVERTLLDVAIRFAPQALDRAVREAEFHHGTRPEDLAAVLRKGHHGSANLRAAIERHVPGWRAMRSRLERRFRSLLVRHGIPLPRRNQVVGPWTVDCLWPELRVVVELDGGQHTRPGQAAVDAQRDLWLRTNSRAG